MVLVAARPWGQGVATVCEQLVAEGEDSALSPPPAICYLCCWQHSWLGRLGSSGSCHPALPSQAGTCACMKQQGPRFPCPPSHSGAGSEAGAGGTSGPGGCFLFKQFPGSGLTIRVYKGVLVQKRLRTTVSHHS